MNSASATSNPADRFEPYRRRLLGLAYPMLGSMADAEDAVQETYLRWHGADRNKVSDTRAFLMTTTTRICLDMLTSARARREEYVGQWLPEPVVDAAALAPDSRTELAEVGCCFFPGSTLEPGNAHISGNAWGADMTFDGQTFPNIGNGNSLTSLSLDLFVTMILPALQASPVTVTAPFTTTAFLFRADPDLPPLEASFQGSGTVSAIFSEVPGGVWASNGVRYDFTQPTPEPATLTLVSGGLIAATIRARKRRDRTTTIQVSRSTPMRADRQE